jgi:hypothetical protein
MSQQIGKVLLTCPPLLLSICFHMTMTTDMILFLPLMYSLVGEGKQMGLIAGAFSIPLHPALTPRFPTLG